MNLGLMVEGQAHLVGYRPRWSSLDAVCESVEWLASRAWPA